MFALIPTKRFLITFSESFSRPNSDHADIFCRFSPGPKFHSIHLLHCRPRRVRPSFTRLQSFVYMRPSDRMKIFFLITRELLGNDETLQVNIGDEKLLQKSFSLFGGWEETRKCEKSIFPQSEFIFLLFGSFAERISSNMWDRRGYCACLHFQEGFPTRDAFVCDFLGNDWRSISRKENFCLVFECSKDFIKFQGVT